MTNPTTIARSVSEAQRAMRCDNCAHWGEPETWDAIAAEMGKCSAITEGWSIADEASHNICSEYGRPDNEWDAKNIDPNDHYMHARARALREARAAVWDGSEYRAELNTTGDFFCAKFAVRAAILAEQEGGA